MRKHALIVLLLCPFLLLIAGCGGSGQTQAPPPVQSTVTITPANATALVGSSLSFTATVRGSSNNQVTFRVIEGASGGEVAANGDYVAPTAPGTFHIRAVSTNDPSQFADAVVMVHDYQRQVERLPDAPDGFDQAATQLLRDGTILIAGGFGFALPHRQGHRYIPEFQSFSPAGAMTTPRLNDAAMMLPDGRVLVTGGDDPALGSDPFRPVLKSSEIYDPVPSQFAAGPEMTVTRRNHVMTQLKDGRIFLSGGIQLAGSGFGASPNTEIYDPSVNTFTASERMLENGRWLHTATLLADGRVLLAGGRNNNCKETCPNFPLNSAEIYDPVSGLFTPTGPMNIARHSHTATLLPDGRVLIIGGETSDSATGARAEVQTTEIYDPVSGAFTLWVNLLQPRGSHAATVLNNGKILITGGVIRDLVATVTTEILDPATGVVVAGPDLHEHHVRHSAIRLRNGEVVVLGGSNLFQAMPVVERFR